MPVIDRDVDEIIDKEIEDDEMKRLLRSVLQWEENRVHSNIRQNKLDAMDERITEYLADK